MVGPVGVGGCGVARKHPAPKSMIMARGKNIFFIIQGAVLYFQ